MRKYGILEPLKRADDENLRLWYEIQWTMTLIQFGSNNVCVFLFFFSFLYTIIFTQLIINDDASKMYRLFLVLSKFPISHVNLHLIFDAVDCHLMLKLFLYFRRQNWYIIFYFIFDLQFFCSVSLQHRMNWHF